MSDVSLTPEAIPSLCNVENPSPLDYSPVVQIIKLKKLKKNNGHGSFLYRLFLSDGSLFCEASLASSLHHLVADGSLDTNCFVRILNYNVVEVHNKIVVIVINLDVLQKSQSPMGTPCRFDGVIERGERKRRPSEMSQDVRNHFFLRNTNDNFSEDSEAIVCPDCSGKPCDWTRYGHEIVAFVKDKCEVQDETPLTNKNKRFLSYVAYSAWKHGFLGRNNRVKVPVCVEEGFRSFYPTEDGSYVGFRPSSDP